MQKLQKNLESLAEGYSNRSNKSKGFITDLSQSLNLEQHEASHYGTFVTENGKTVTIRVSNHNARVSNFDRNGEIDGISIVISSHGNKGLNNDGNAHIVEFFYSKQSLERSEGKPLADIILSVSKALKSGEFKDNTGLAQRQEVNEQIIREQRLTNTRLYDPRASISPVRGQWTKDKILRRLKDIGGSRKGLIRAAKIISEFDSPEELEAHMYYHGTQYGGGALKPSILMSDRDIERYGGGGYGVKYWGISVSKSKKVASNFSQGEGVSIYPIILCKSAKVVEVNGVEDAEDLDEYIEQLWKDGVDAVWIGKGEQELCVLNPNAIVNIDRADYYRYYKLGSEENPLKIIDKEGITRITQDDASEILVLRPNGSIKAYQKGFTKDELKKWCETELGSDYSVEIANEKNAGGSYDTAVVVTKNSESDNILYRQGEDTPHVSTSSESKTKAAQKATENLNLGSRVVVYESVEGLEGKEATAKGWYDTKTGQIHVVLSNNTDAADVMQTILHEAVAHHGLRDLFGHNVMDAFLDSVLAAASQEVKDAINGLRRENGWNFRTATEEYLAGLAERTDFERMTTEERGLFATIRRLFNHALEFLGLKNHELSDRELAYILWCIYQDLQSNHLLCKKS